MKNLFVFIFASMLITWSGCNQEERLKVCYRNSVAWMWNQQGADGGWHSETHAVLRDGKALTPYILYYLLQVPDDIYSKKGEAVKRAIAFIKNDIWHHDSLFVDNYPNYAAAYVLRVLCYLKIDSALQRKLTEHLVDQQFLENRGTLPENMAYGGWGYGETDLKPGEFGHVDISHTRRITEALREEHYFRGEDYEPGPSYYRQYSIGKDTITLSPMDRWKAIHIFLQGVQRSPEDHRLYEGCTDRTNIPYDGGFVSSMYTLSTNKCQPYNVNDCYYYPSYATATCDGLLALNALGEKNSQAFKDAANWLKEHQRIDVIDGLSKDDPGQWYQIMHYYHWSVRAEAMRVAGIEGPWKKDLIHALITEQQSNGFYINPLGGVNKEDDPLMATIFCVQAFSNITDY